MPIIPVLQPEGDVSVPNFGTPDINSLSSAYASKSAAGIGQLGSEAASLVTSRMHVAARMDAIKASNDMATKLDELRNSVMNQPLKVRPGASVDEEGASEGQTSVGSGTIPRSETMLDDYKKGAENVRQQAEKNLSGLAYQYAAPGINRAFRSNLIKMQDQQNHTFNQEQIITMGQGAAEIHKRTTLLPPDQPVGLPGGAISYQPENNVNLQGQVKDFNTFFDQIASQTGMNPQLVEKARTTEIAKLYKNFAEKTMHADPESWALATEDGKNGWHKYMDDIPFDRLADKAHAAVSRKNGDEERQKKLIREKADSDLSVFEAAGSIPMDEIVSRAPNLGRDGVSYWKTVREGLQNGKWDDVPEVKRDLEVRVSDFRPAPGIEREVDQAFSSHQISYDTHKAFKAEIRQSREREQRIGIDANVRQASREHEYLSATLQPSPQMKDDKGVLKANYADAHGEWSRRIQSEGEANASQITEEVIKKYRPRIRDYVDNHMTELRTQFPDLKIDTNGMVDAESVRETRMKLAERFGVTPENLGAMRRSSDPTAQRKLQDFHDGLSRIDDILELARMKRSAAEVK